MHELGLRYQLIVGIALIAGMASSYWWAYPPFARTDGPPTGEYTVSVPSKWVQRYIEASETFALSPGDEGQDSPTLFISEPKVERPEGSDKEVRAALLKAYKKILKTEKCQWGEDIVIDGATCWRIDAEVGRQPDMYTGGLTKESTVFVVLVTKPKALELKFSCEKEEFAKHVEAALEAVASLDFP